MKEQSGKEKKEKKKSISKEKRFYLFTASVCAAALVAIVVVAVLVANFGSNEVPTTGKLPPLDDSTSSSSPSDGNVGDDELDDPVITVPEGMIMPLESVSVSNDFGFYHNLTLNKYYEHTGVDFSAEAGAEVLAVEDGVVESIYQNDTLTGTEITRNHGDGMKTVYRFVVVGKNISVGMEVKKGDVIATVAEATGAEYKDGANLHFEIVNNGESVDPATYLTFEEK